MREAGAGAGKVRSVWPAHPRVLCGLLSPSRRELAHEQFVSVGTREIPKKKRRKNVSQLGGARESKRVAARETHAREHRHGTVRHGAEQVDREALVEPAPALKVDNLARGADDAGALARRARGEQQPPLRLQARAHDFVRVGRHRGRHLGHRGAKEDRMRRHWPIVAMSFWKWKMRVRRKEQSRHGTARHSERRVGWGGGYVRAMILSLS